MLKSFWVSNFGSNLLFFQISNLKGSNFVKWQDDQNKSCRSSWPLQLWCSTLIFIWDHLVSQNYFSSFDFNFLKFKFFSQIISTVRSPQPTTQISWIGFYRKLILLLRLTLSGFCSASFLLLPLLIRIHPNKYILSFIFSFTKLLFPSSLSCSLSLALPLWLGQGATVGASVRVGSWRDDGGHYPPPP